MRVSVDPGKKEAGIAAWENGELACAFLARGEDWDSTAFSAYGMLLERFPREVLLGAELILERPQIYQQKYLKGDPNDLIPLALMGGAFAGYLFSFSPVLYYPREWKKQVPKDVMTERIKRRLSKDEHRRVELPRAKSLHHNIWDGVGIGLFRLGRLRAGTKNTTDLH